MAFVLFRKKSAISFRNSVTEKNVMNLENTLRWYTTRKKDCIEREKNPKFNVEVKIVNHIDVEYA